MLNIKEYLNSAIIKILQDRDYKTTDAIISQSNRPDLSDYQSNVAMPLAKAYKKTPRDIAAEIAPELEKIEGVSTVRIDGPGFININLKQGFLEGIESTKEEPRQASTVVIDYGGPNIAKALHVGHLRPAIIGESIKRIMRHAGDNVIGDVHFGDWGTPIGMLIAQLRIEQPDLEFYRPPFTSSEYDTDIVEISALYKRAAANFKESEVFKEAARIATAELQRGNSGYRALWSIFKKHSVDAVKSIYDDLGVEFDLWLGESDVNDMLPPLFEDLTRRGIAKEDAGAIIVPLPDKGNKERAPFILRKTDGGYTYAATDLATIIQRIKDYNPKTIIYVTDVRQKEHFEQVFEVARTAGFVDDSVSLEHVWFGTINGEDGKALKSRSGETVSLQEIIDLAYKKTKEILPPNHPDFTMEELQKQSNQIAIGALIFQDLKNTRTSDYIFDTEGFTKPEGKTGAYIQYAIARINSVLEKSEDNVGGNPMITHKLERELLLHLYRKPEAIAEAYKRREPSVISEYIYNLAQKFSTFYAELSINNEPDAAIKKSRIKMATLTRETLVEGLGLLNIGAPKRMIKAKNA